MKIDISAMSADKIQKQVEYYIKLRSVHKNQAQKVSAHDLIKKFKHIKYSSGKNRLSFYNDIIRRIINDKGDSNVNGVKLIILFTIKK